MIGITLLLPTKNEAGGIRKILDDVSGLVDEILVVDGHSTDGTAELARQAGARVLLDSGRGKGDAIRLGFREASHEIVVIMDADGSHDPRDIPRLVAPIEAGEADLVVGSRVKGGSDEQHGDLDNFLRSIGAGIITIAINYRFGVRITDALNGFRALRRSVGLNLNLRANDFDIEQHMVVQALRLGYRVREVASHESARQWGKSKLPTFKKAYLFLWRLAWDLLPPFRR